MGRHPSPSSGPEWLPGELDAIFATEPADDGPGVPDPSDDSWVGPDEDLDLDDEFGSDPDPDDQTVFGPAGCERAGSGSVVDRFAVVVDRLEAVVGELVSLAADPGLGLADRDRLSGWMQELERCRNRLQVPDQVLVNLMETAGCRLEGPLGLFASPQAYLTALLGICPGEARARVRAAQVLAPRRTMDGRWVPARYPVLAKVQAAGEIGPDRVAMVTRALLDWEKLLPVAGNNVTVESLAEAEEVLAGQAPVFGGRQLRQVIDRVGDWLVPDGLLDDRAGQEAVRSLQVRPIVRGMHKGMYQVEGRLTAEAGAKALAVLDPLSKPRPVLDETGHVVESDRRDREVRMHDALEEVLDRCLRAGDLPAHGGTPTTLILITRHEHYAAAAAAAAAADPESTAAESADGGSGFGVTETGDVLATDTVVSLADEAEIVRTVFDKQTGDVLYLGRTRRLASYAQTLALAARDGGCTFPGCDKSPKWCQRHVRREVLFDRLEV